MRLGVLVERLLVVVVEHVSLGVHIEVGTNGAFVCSLVDGRTLKRGGRKSDLRWE